MPPSPAPSARFYLIDVFAQRPLTGNPLALVPDADDLTEAQMRAIAREFNQSETTFLLHPGMPGATWQLRSFTPIGAEVYGAGHNALGAWLWLAGSGRLPSGQDGFAQQIGTEVLPVRVDRTGSSPVVSMDQSAPVFGGTAGDRAELAGSLGLAEDDLAPGVTAQVAGTGASHLMVAVGARAAVDRAQPDAVRLAAVLAHTGGEGAYLYSLEPADDDAVAYSRFFNPVMGIAEDPATGTAAGPLAALLVRSGVAAEGTVVIEQGRALGRPSRIQVTVTGDQVTVSGSGLVVAEGTIRLE